MSVGPEPYSTVALPADGARSRTAPEDGVLEARARDQARKRALAAAVALGGVLLIAAALRLWGLLHDLPFSYYGDELHFMRRAMAMGTGDLNPHWFHKPAFLMYVLAFVYGVYFVVGAAAGRFDSPDAFGAAFLADAGPFLLLGRLVVFAFGVATVWIVYRLALRAFGTRRAALTSAFVAAVLPPMIASSQVIKSDVPAGCLIAAAVLLQLGAGPDGRRRRALAAIVAGVATGTHYYGFVLLPALLADTGLSLLRREVALRAAIGRALLASVLFVGGFFVASPYNFLDPQWGLLQLREVGHGLGITEPETKKFEIDSRTIYEPGPSAWGGAAVHFAGVVVSSESMGVALAALALLGLAALLPHRELHRYLVLVGVPIVMFVFAALVYAAYHAQPRHLNGVYPLLATAVWPGGVTVARLLRVSARWRGWIAALVIGLACIPAIAQSIEHNQMLMRPDSRLVARDWILAELPADARILVEDHGPSLNPSVEAVDRQQALLETLPVSPFTANQGRRLELLERYPPANGRDIEELGHQWWRRRERPDAQLRADPVDLDMSNPLVSRQPRTLAEYRAAGIRYVVANSIGKADHTVKAWRVQAFPSFARFYRELDALTPIATFDPATWGGKGPVIWVYDLAARPARTETQEPERTRAPAAALTARN